MRVTGTAWTGPGARLESTASSAPACNEMRGTTIEALRGERAGDTRAQTRLLGWRDPNGEVPLIPISRRHFLKAGAAASAALLIPNGLQLLAARAAAAGGKSALMAKGYGPLVPDPAGLLDLPARFQYRALSSALLGKSADARFTQRLSNGELVPAQHDGMAAFRGLAGITILVRNHEMEPLETPAVDPGHRRPYDRLGTGGTTTR